MRSATCSRRGPARADNSDYPLADPGLGLYALADGEGSGAPAQAAAAASVRAVERVLGAWRVARDVSATQAEVRAFETANTELWKLANSQKAYAALTTSLGALLLDGPLGVYIGVGRVDLFRMREGKLVRIDPGWQVGDAVLGAEPTLAVKPTVLELRPRDTFLLVSDGVQPTRVKREDLRAALVQSQPHLAAEYVVALALDRGGVDNASAVVVTVDAAG